MNSEHQLQLEDAQKKLSLFRKHLDMLVQGVWESKNISSEEVLAAVTELESLIEWATQQSELQVESGLLLEKLQQLHKIRENLQTPSIDVKQLCTTDPTCAGDDKIETCSKDLLDNEVVDIYNNIEDKKQDISLISLNTVLTDNQINTNEQSNVIDITKSCEENEKNVNITDISGNFNVDFCISGSNENESIPPSCIISQEIEIPSSNDWETNFFKSLNNEIVILETNEENKTIEVVSDPKCTTDPLDVSMYAIKNLYESLRTKENELLKLSVMQNDQKHIEALQEVIIDFHKDITNLNIQLDQSKKENAVLKEQVLELEEAENDARLAAQNLEQKLVFLQEKDSHSQAELYQLKQNLKKSVEILALKEVSEKELRSQLKYMETLVQKYEDQIRALELKQKQENEIRAKQEKKSFHERGTQTYDPPAKDHSKFQEIPENNSNDKTPPNLDINETHCANTSNTVNNGSKENKIESNNLPITENSTSIKTSQTEDQVSGASLSQNELLKRLHKLIEDDAELQQQIHNVDQINLAMWMKLQNLEIHIGKCKRQNINETNNDIDMSLCSSPFTEFEKPIPLKELDFPHQTEQSIQERLVKLEEINAAFERDLSDRDKLCKDSNTKNKDWNQMEEDFKKELKRLAIERDTLMDQVTSLMKEKEALQQRVLQQQTGINSLKEKNHLELNKIKSEQELMTVQLHQKVKQLLSKEKEHLKMITNLKSERNSIQDKTELERLKCSYIELQLELSQSRDEIKKLEDDFKLRLEQCMKLHAAEETRLVSELEHLRKDNTHCDKMINELQSKQEQLSNTLQQQEKRLELARENYEKNLVNIVDERHSSETGLSTQFREIEEDTAIATAAIAEERVKVEKELQESINDLRIKEESYKTTIADLESNVKQLRQELNKMARGSEVTVQDNISIPLNDKNIISEPAADQCLPGSELNSSDDVNEAQSQQPPSLPTLEDKNVHEKIPNQKDEVVTEMDKTSESVDQLRAQVRQLQSQLEKISESDFAEESPVPSVSPINTFSMGIPKEDLDYAEIEECTGVKQEKQTNTEKIKHTSPNLERLPESQTLASYRNNIPNENSMPEQSNEDNDYDEVLPRPTNFHVVQQVGSDTLLVGWNYVNPSVLDGFEVYLNNEVHERIYIPDRTKALISGLDLRKPIRLSIYALSRYGQMSEPAVLELTPHPKTTRYIENSVEGEYKTDLQNAMAEQQRPYSMEW